jgi:UDP-glucose-4-epimerase GalE
MKLLVTGGAGYVGSHCVRHLCDSGHAVTVLDNLSQGHRAAVDPRAAFVAGDIGDRLTLDRVLSGAAFEGVMHFAAHLNVGESVADPLKYYENNVSRTVTLLAAMRDASVKRMIFSSTAAVYGEPPAVPITEEMPKAPINPYGHSKLAMEWALQDCAAAWGLGSVSLRYFNASGASADGTIGEHHDPEMHLIPLVLQAALGHREHIAIYGRDYPTPDGTCVRDYVHVEDLATAHRLALESITSGHAERYNVGTGRGHSVLEVIDAARRVTGLAVPAKDAPRRPGDPPSLYASADKLRRALGWTPCYTEIDAIVASAWKWHSTHPHGFAV